MLATAAATPAATPSAANASNSTRNSSSRSVTINGNTTSIKLTNNNNTNGSSTKSSNTNTNMQLKTATTRTNTIQTTPKLAAPMPTTTTAQIPAATVAPAPATTTTTTLPRRTTITSDPGILCFHHCNVKVFCFALPRICPNCQMELYTLPATDDDDDDEDDDDNDDDDVDDGDNDKRDKEATRATANGVNGTSNSNSSKKTRNNRTQSNNSKLPKLMPFRLPYPFVRAAQYPCAIVLRPSVGDFLNDYNNSTDLHIAVTTSTGCIVEFDRNGLQRHRPDANASEWLQCLLVGDVPEPWYDYWDQILMQTCKQQPARWTIEQYDEHTHNCYTFVLAFLQALAYEKLSAAASSKTSFCERFIVPRTTTAGKYISLYRKLRAVGIYVHAARRPHSFHHTKNNNNSNKISNGGGNGNHYANYYYSLNGKAKRLHANKMHLLNSTAAASAANANTTTTTTTTTINGITITTTSTATGKSTATSSTATNGGISSSLSQSLGGGGSNGSGLLLARAPTLCTIEE